MLGLRVCLNQGERKVKIAISKKLLKAIAECLKHLL